MKVLAGPFKGFTLVEMMLVLLLMAILLRLGVPALQQLFHASRVRLEAHRVLAALNLARSEAISRNLPVSICPSEMSQSGVARCASRLSSGWIIFSNPDRDREIDSGTDEVIRAFDGLPAGYTFSNRKGEREAGELISYLPDGSSRRNLTLMICPTGGLRVEPLAVVISRSGRPRLARDWGQCSPS